MPVQVNSDLGAGYAIIKKKSMPTDDLARSILRIPKLSKIESTSKDLIDIYKKKEPGKRIKLPKFYR